MNVGQTFHWGREVRMAAAPVVDDLWAGDAQSARDL